MEKSVSEILDGYSIAKIKDVKIGNEATRVVLKSYQAGFEEIKVKYTTVDWDLVLKSFVDVNETIWKYEAAIRQGLVDDDIAFVASRAVLVREFNQLRVGFMNVVSALVGQKGAFNVKKDHVSE